MNKHEMQTQMERLYNLLFQAYRERDQAKGMLAKEIESNLAKANFIREQSEKESKIISNLYLLAYILKDNEFTDEEKIKHAIKTLKEIGIN